MLISVLGNLGSGKTLFLAYMAKMKIKRDIYSNFLLKTNNYHPLSIIDLLDLKDNIVVFIDEAYTWLESRTSSSTLNRFLSYVVLQSRKRTIDIYITAQLFSSVDIRFRHQSNIIVKAYRNNKGFLYTFLNVENSNITSFLLPFNKAKKYYSIYDTYEIIEPHKKKYLEFKLLESEPDKLKEHVNNLAEIIRPKIKKLTHDSLKRCLMNESIEIGYEKYLYPILKEICYIDDD